MSKLDKLENESDGSLYDKARKLCDKGSKFYDLKSWDFAIKLFTEAHEIKPDYERALRLRAHAYLFGIRDYEKAIADLTALLELKCLSDKKKAEDLSLIFLAHLMNNEDDKALALWEELCQISPSDALKVMPKIYLDMEMCLIFVKKEAASLKFVPDEFKTVEMCLEAVKQDSRLLSFVPEKFKDAVTLEARKYMEELMKEEEEKEK